MSLRALMSWQERKKFTGQGLLQTMEYLGSDYNNGYNVIKEIKDKLAIMYEEQQQQITRNNQEDMGKMG